MTISSTRGTKPTIDRFVLDAWIYAGLLPETVATTDPHVTTKLAYGRRMLDLVLDEMSNMTEARFTDFEDVTMVASQQAYTLSADILEVVGKRAVHIPASEASTETYSSSSVVKVVTRDMWHVLTGKDSTGTPTVVYPHIGTEDVYTISLRVWPLPDEASTIKLQVQRAPADTLVGSDTLDVKSQVHGYLLHELAARLCFRTNPAKSQVLSQKAMLLKREARAFGDEHRDGTFYWAGRRAQSRRR